MNMYATNLLAYNRTQITSIDIVLSSSWSYDKTDEAWLLTEHSNVLSLGWNVITRAAPSCRHVNLGTTYLNVPLATVHHLYTVILTVYSRQIITGQV